MPKGAQLRGQVGTEMRPTLPWPSHAPWHWAASVQRKGRIFLSTGVSCEPHLICSRCCTAQKRPFSNDKSASAAGQAPTNEHSLGWRGQRASKVASPLSGTDGDSSFLGPSMVPLCSSPPWFLCGEPPSPPALQRPHMEEWEGRSFKSSKQVEPKGEGKL